MSYSASAVVEDGHDEEFHDDIIYPDALSFTLMHLVCVAAIWTGVTQRALVLGGVLYLIRMFAVTAGYHRYFSHRSYRTSRVGQFVLAVLCQTSTQKSVLWWAAKHRHHHKHTDTEHDVHSPRQRGFWYSHLGWIFSRRHEEANFDTVPDLTRYPELVWLARYEQVPAIALGAACFAFAGWPGLIVGFFWSTVVLDHCTFAINSLAHVVGKQRYLTGDDSRNNWWLALLTLGEGWHNNHHYYMSSTRQGFRWWEIDPTYYVLRVLAWMGIVWDLREPPAAVVRGEQRVGARTIDKVAHQLAESFGAAAIAAQVQAAWVRARPVEELSEWARTLCRDTEAALAEAEAMALALPTVEEVRRRALQMFVHTPAMDEIVQRSRLVLARAVAARLVDDEPPLAAA